MKRLKILLIYPGYPPEEALGGGISTYAREAAEGLIGLGHRVTVISRTEKTDFSIEIKNNLKIVRVPCQGFNRFGVLFYSFKVKRIIEKLEQKKENMFDVIEVGDWGAEAVLLLRKFGHKLVIRCHTPGFISESYNPLNPPYLSGFVKKLEKYVLARAKFIACPSRSLVVEIKKYVNIKAQVTIQPYPLTVSEIPWKLNYRKKFDKFHPLRILTAGRLEQRKGQDIICRAVNIISDKGFPVALTFAGSDTLIKSGIGFKNELSKILKPQLLKSVRFLGQVKQNDMPEIFINHDLFVMASRFESLGFVTLEAMRTGLPVVAANVCEAPNLIAEGKTGKLFKNGDPLDLSDKIIGLLTDFRSAVKMGQTARKYIIENYGRNRPVKLMAAYFASIINTYGDGK